MKAVILLLSVWLLILAGIPCPDADCHIHEAPTETSSHQADEHEHGHKSPCSPFCHCATCLGFSVSKPFVYTLPEQLAVPVMSQQLFDYQSPSQADVIVGIWQPPKL
ncbi:DUF6660 family protein [Spirosoma gilvum]